MKKTLTPRERLRRDGVRTRLPDGRRAIVATYYSPTRGRVAVVKPLGGK